MQQRDSTLKLARPQPTQVIAVTGGKGGVGKTTVAVNLGAALAHSGRNVLLLDGDLGLANIDVQLGLTPRFTLEHVLRGERTLAEVMQPVRERLQVIPAASGVARMARLKPAEHAALIQSFATLPQAFDTLLVDTAAGIGEQVLQFAAAAAHVLVVLCDEPASLTDAYGLIKVLNRDCGVQRFEVLVNRVAPGDSGELLFRRLQKVTDRYLDLQLTHAGDIPDDPLLMKAVRSQRAVVHAWPGSPAARAMSRLATRTGSWTRPAAGSGRIEFFFERLNAQRQHRMQVVK